MKLSTVLKWSAGIACGFAPHVLIAADVALPQIRVDGTPLDRLNRSTIVSYADALEPIRRCVVSVHSTRIVRSRGADFPFDDPVLRRFFGFGADGPTEERVPAGLGSGVIVSADGFILTNNHVVAESDEISVALPDGREMPARVIGADPKTDIAVVKIDATGLDAATLADSAQLRVGDVVFAIGNPLGVGQTTTMGIVSATGRTNLRLIEQGYEDFIQTDASINPGNSGGALVDAQGRLVGINTAIISTSRGNIGIGFAVPVNLAAHVMRSLIQTGLVRRGYLGVELQNLDGELAAEFGVADGRGVIVRDVVPGGPAERAGLQHGDVIVAFDGRAVANTNELRLAISQGVPGTTVTVRVIRDRMPRDVAVELLSMDGEETAEGDQLLDGVHVRSLTPRLREEYGIPNSVQGLVIVGVERNSRYGDVLAAGTVIEQINRRVVADVRTARAALGRGRNLFLVNQGGVRQYVLIVLN